MNKQKGAFKGIGAPPDLLLDNYVVHACQSRVSYICALQAKSLGEAWDRLLFTLSPNECLDELEVIARPLIHLAELPLLFSLSSCLPNDCH